MKNTKKVLISLIVLGVTSLSLISEDFSKFLLSGQSNTYDISLFRHNPVLIFTISLLVILFIFLYQRGKLYKWLLGVSMVIWILSQKTYAIVYSHDKVIISGFTVIPVSRCKLNLKENCKVKFDFFMPTKVEEAIKEYNQ